MDRTSAYTTKQRFLLGALCLVVSILLLAGAWTLPFLYETSSMLYKFGVHKLMLRSGKLVGLTVGILLLFQLTAVSHFSFLEKGFSKATLLRFHKTNGLVLVLVIVLHPLLILAADDFASYTLEKKYWPEFVGGALFICLILLVLTAQYRSRLKMQYRRWLTLHRFGAMLVLTLFYIHMLFVSETFRGGIPYSLALGLAGFEALLFLKIFVRAYSTDK